MAKADRQSQLDSIDLRHDALIDELDALNAQIESALVACGVKPQPDDNCTATA